MFEKTNEMEYMETFTVAEGGGGEGRQIFSSYMIEVSMK